MMEELHSNKHEETVRVSRAKNDRHFLETEWGVGVTSLRGKMMGPAWCQFCGLGEYMCIGSVCLGLKPIPKRVTILNRSHRHSKENIPGLDFKKAQQVVGVAARLPKGRRGEVSSAVYQAKSLGYTKTVGEGANRNMKIPRHQILRKAVKQKVR